MNIQMAAVADGSVADLDVGARQQALIDGSAALLRAAVQAHPRVVYANSLGAEAMVLTDLICTHAPAIEMFTVDTGRLPEETHALLERMERHYQRRIRVYYPRGEAVESWVDAHGINGFYQAVAARRACCQVRKVEPFLRAIQGFGAWVTGLRREQSEQRAAAVAFEARDGYGLAKYCPLLDWREADIWHYIRQRRLPYNPLHDRAFASLGCAPCTRAIEDGQDQRAGRWWWERPDSRECGLHPRAGSALEI